MITLANLQAHSSVPSERPKISFVIPFYKRFELFNQVIDRNYAFQDSRVELVLVLDEPSEEHLIKEHILPRICPLIKLRLIVNDEEHTWRPPCKAINVGIRMALGEYVSVMSPESILLLPEKDYLFDLVEANAGNRCFFTGRFHNANLNILDSLDCFGSRSKGLHNNLLGIVQKGNYGFVLFKRQHAFEIYGYDEGRKHYGGDDDDFRERLQNHGVTRVQENNLQILHILTKTVKRQRAIEPYGIDVKVPKQECFGTSFARVSYDWAAVSAPIDKRLE